MLSLPTYFLKTFWGLYLFTDSTIKGGSLYRLRCTPTCYGTMEALVTQLWNSSERHLCHPNMRNQLEELPPFGPRWSLRPRPRPSPEVRALRSPWERQRNHGRAWGGTATPAAGRGNWRLTRLLLESNPLRPVAVQSLVSDLSRTENGRGEKGGGRGLIN